MPYLLVPHRTQSDKMAKDPRLRTTFLGVLMYVLLGVVLVGFALVIFYSVSNING